MECFGVRERPCLASKGRLRLGREDSRQLVLWQRSKPTTQVSASAFDQRPTQNTPRDGRRTLALEAVPPSVAWFASNASGSFQNRSGSCVGTRALRHIDGADPTNGNEMVSEERMSRHPTGVPMGPMLRRSVPLLKTRFEGRSPFVLEGDLTTIALKAGVAAYAVALGQPVSAHPMPEFGGGESACCIERTDGGRLMVWSIQNLRLDPTPAFVVAVDDARLHGFRFPIAEVVQ